MVPLQVARFVFNLAAVDTIKLPPFAGSTLRGGFGIALKRLVCTLRRASCEECLLVHRCPYAYIFETPPFEDASIMRKYPHAPHPFVLEVPLVSRTVYRPGEDLSFGLILIGRAVDYFPYIVYAFQQLGEIGLGRGRGKFQLSSIERLSPTAESQTIFDTGTGVIQDMKTSYNTGEIVGEGKPPKKVSITFLTPTRIKFNGHLSNAAEFHILFRNLLRRLSALSYFHCTSTAPEIDYKGLVDRSREVRIRTRELRWHDWERYSARQDTKMSMGGFLGRVVYEGNFEEFWPYLKLGEMVHVGKGTVFGLGKYRLDSAGKSGKSSDEDEQV